MGIIELDEISGLMATYFIPAKWGDAGIAYKDLIDIQAALSVNCKLEKFINKIA
tara:strand:- start:298 stop:459 length:162 start_codon:yes stop_codon:yes gene_type:complete